MTLLVCAFTIPGGAEVFLFAIWISHAGWIT